MKKCNVKQVFFAILLACFLQPALGVAAGHISSAELIGNAKEYEGRQVIYRGEVIGEVMRRGDFAWVNLHDGGNAIGIWVPFSLAKDIVYTGSYKAKGDIVEVTGIFNRACPEHGGDLDIHAQSFLKIEHGRPVLEVINPAKKNQVLILGGFLVLVWILIVFLRK